MKIQQELHLEEDIVRTLEKEAKKQNLSLKNYLENLAVQQAGRLEVLSKEYTYMMDNLLDRFDKNEIEFSSINEALNRNGISGSSS
ncbi:hypothetical protein [Aquimarina algiphila]|uniref:Uncharacterized protein n=1 Tax=Aquimarina algiphila TaxID=2047982 RepID=A0A554VF94_9FLAO|nr:hypothetical protein [Aquimarina algiphila]TSE05825.1 hypothetical protein FOF46_21550 [Aquimarina algiphila]